MTRDSGKHTPRKQETSTEASPKRSLFSRKRTEENAHEAQLSNSATQQNAERPPAEQKARARHAQPSLKETFKETTLPEGKIVLPKLEFKRPTKSSFKFSLKNVFAIVRDDIADVKASAIGLMVAIGLIVIPGMYAWMCIAGAWDPYENTGSLKVAVVNNDQGYKNDVLPVPINIGDTICAKLKTNDSFDWVFVSEDDALHNVGRGTYYAALVLPENFSKSLLEILSGVIRSVVIDYYSNQKNTPIASRITDQGADAIQQEINQKFNSALTEVGLSLALNMVELVGSDTIKEFVNELNAPISSASNDLSMAASQLRALVKALDAAGDMGINLANSLNDAAGTMSSASDPVAISSQRIDEVINNADALGLDASAVSSLQDLKSQLNSSTSNISAVESALRSAASIVSNNAVPFDQKITDVSGSLNAKVAEMESTAASLSELSADLAEAAEENDLETIQNLIGDNPDSLASLIANPVLLQREAFFPVENNGSAMGGFYTALAIWVGSTIMVMLVRGDVPKRRRSRYPDLRAPEEFLGRYGIIALISSLQAILAAIGNIVFVGIQCVHPVLFVLCSWATAISFSLFVYTICVSFGPPGKGIAVICLVLQVAGSGAIFPIETSSELFHTIYPFLPFTYSMRALNACIAGIYGTEVIGSLGFLLILVGISLIIGMVLRNPIIRFNKWFVRWLEKTQFM